MPCDLSFFASIFLLIALASGAIGYQLGRHHGHAAGRITGHNEARSELLPRVMKAKHDGTRAGRILGMREAIREMLPGILNNRPET